MGTLLIGYDVECLDIPGRGLFEETKRFLELAPKVHKKYGVPCTLFVCGKTLEGNTSDFKKIKNEDLLDFEQHTYSHEGPVLKTVVQQTDESIFVGEGMPLEKIREEVDSTNRLLKNILDVNCIGLRGPWGYYRGLSDRPDILRLLNELGICFLSTYARNEKDFMPVDFKVQPFWYTPQGLDDILEIPAQGWQDLYMREKLGWKNTDGYLSYLKKNIDYITEHDLVWGHVAHDHSALKEDPQMSIIAGLIDYALKKKVRVLSYRQYYEEMMRNKCKKKK